MKGILITEEEKNRILNSHKFAIKSNYLQEQGISSSVAYYGATPPQTSTTQTSSDFENLKKKYPSNIKKSDKDKSEVVQIPLANGDFASYYSNNRYYVMSRDGVVKMKGNYTYQNNEIKTTPDQTPTNQTKTTKQQVSADDRVKEVQRLIGTKDDGKFGPKSLAKLKEKITATTTATPTTPTTPTTPATPATPGQNIDLQSMINKLLAQNLGANNPLQGLRMQ